MDVIIAWSGFLGAWLLVAGPIYQAAIELEEEDVERDVIADASATVEAPPRVSPWWWLLPPVAYLLHRRRGRVYRQAVMEVLAPEHLEQIIRFGNKATGWLFVALGAFFIAVKETWELGEIYHWPVIIFWSLIIVMLIASAVNTIVRMRRTHVMLGESAPGRA